MSRLDDIGNQINEIEGTITLVNGEQVKFSMSREGVTRWGNLREVVGHTVDATEAMLEASVTDFAHLDDIEEYREALAQDIATDRAIDAHREGF